MKLKPYALCQCLVYIRYRIQYRASGDCCWACPNCQHQVQPDNPHYRYGAGNRGDGGRGAW